MGHEISANGASSPPAFDLTYGIEDYECDQNPDSLFVYRRVEEMMLREGTVPGGRTLDVACGVGQLSVGVQRGGGTAVGLDASQEMLGLSRFAYPDEPFPLVRAVSETLPFRDATFDRVICQCSLDHFVDPHAFMREAARVLKPGRRVVIALSNYESLSCRFGRLRDRLVRLVKRSVTKDRPFWKPPPDHVYKGDLDFIRGLGAGALRLERCEGISLMWLSYNWGDLLERLPGRATNILLHALDRIARRAPALADIVISVWEPVPGGASAQHMEPPARPRGRML